MPREGETPESQKWDQMTDKPHSSGRGRRAVPPDAAPEILGGGPPRTYDPFELSARSKKEFGIDDSTHTYTWVRNPAIYEDIEGSNRVDEMKDFYDGAEVVLRSESREPVRRSDTILMKLPIEHLQKKEQDCVDRCLDWYAMNPAVALANGKSYDEVMEIIEERGSDALVAARSQYFDFGDGKKAKALAEAARAISTPRRNLNGSPTYGQPYERAYNNQIASIQMQNPGMSWRQAETAHAEEIDRKEDRAMMGATMDRGAENWADDVERSARKSAGMYNIGANFGPRTEDVIRARHGRNNRPNERR